MPTKPRAIIDLLDEALQSQRTMFPEPTILDPSALPPPDAAQIIADRHQDLLNTFPDELLAGSSGIPGDNLRAATLREVVTGRGEKFERKGVTFWAESPSLDNLDDFLESAQRQAAHEERPFRALKAVACWLYYTTDADTGEERLATAAEIGRCFGAGDVNRIVEDMAFYLGLTMETSEGKNA